MSVLLLVLTVGWLLLLYLELNAKVSLPSAKMFAH